MVADSHRPRQYAVQDTELATRLATNPNDYLEPQPGIGRAVSPGVRELFVACEPGEALVQQFERVTQRHIALHDLGCQAARQLLSSIAIASGQTLEKLVVRRTGYGTVLAAIEYVDCPTAAGAVRLYFTDAADSDTVTRASLARVLLGHAALVAVLVGEQPAHALDALLTQLKESFGGTSACSDLLFLPLGPSQVMRPRAQHFANTSGRLVRLGPQVATPAEAWQPMRAAWNGLSTVRDAPEPPLLPELLVAAPQRRNDVATAPERLIETLGAQPGVVDACLFEVSTSRVLMHLGSRETAVELARRGTLLLAAGGATRRSLQLAGTAQNVVVHGQVQANAVHVLPSQPSWALHLVFTPALADWPALQAQLIHFDQTWPRGPVL